MNFLKSAFFAALLFLPLSANAKYESPLTYGQSKSHDKKECDLKLKAACYAVPATCNTLIIVNEKIVLCNGKKIAPEK